MADNEYVPGVGPIRFEGADAAASLAFRYYDADRLVAGRKMRDQLRFAVCWWHSFSWHGSDVFGAPTRRPPWLRAGDSPLDAATRQADAAFEFFTKLGVDFFTFHDRDDAPEGTSFAESQDNFNLGSRPAFKVRAPTCGGPARTIRQTKSSHSLCEFACRKVWLWPPTAS